MTSRIYLLLCLLLCVAGCARRSYPSHDKDAGAPLFGGGGPASLPISFLVKPDAGTQQIVCSADGGCVYVECDAGEVFMRVDGSASRCTQISSGGSFPIVPGAIIYEPGGVSSGNVCATEACVAAAVNAAPGPAVYINCTLGSATITNTQWNFGGYGGLTSIGNTCTLAVSGTGQLQNLLNLTGVEIINNKTSGAVMSLSLPGQPVVTLSSGSQILTGASASAPVWAQSSGSLQIILQGASGFATNNASQAIVALTGSATLNLNPYQVGGPVNALIPSVVSGSGGTTLNVYGDTSAFPWVTQSLFSGTLHLHRIDMVQGLAGCDGGGVPTGGDGGVSPFWCNYSGGGGGTYTGTAPIVVSGSVISISAATTSAAGSIKLANDLAGTGASPEVLYLANQSSIADTSGDLALGTTTIPADSQTKSLFLANGTTPSTTTASGQWLTGVTDGAVHPGYTLNITSDGFLTQIGTFGGASTVLGQGIAFGSADRGGGTLIGQASSATATTGSNLAIYAQGTTAASSTGGGVQIYAGSGSSATGQVFLGGTNTSFGSGASLTVNTTVGGLANGVTITSSSATPLTVTDSSSLTTSITGSSISNGRFAIEPIPGFTATDTGFYAGPATISPSATNYAIDCNSTACYFNGPTGTSSANLSVGGTVVWKTNGATTNYEAVAPSGVNVGIGSVTAAGADTGTNLLDFTHGTANTVCGGDVCLSGVSSGGLFALSQHGFATYLAPDLTGTVNTQHDIYERPAACVGTLTGVSQSLTCTFPKITTSGLVAKFTCSARTVAAGSSGAIGDFSWVTNTGICSTGASTTVCSNASSTTALTTGTQTLQACQIASSSNIPTVSLESSGSLGSSLSVDVIILLEGIYD